MVSVTCLSVSINCYICRNNGLPEYDISVNSTTATAELASFVASKAASIQAFITTFVILGEFWSKYCIMPPCPMS